MIRRRKLSGYFAGSTAFLPLGLFILLVAFFSWGCEAKGHTSDARLKKIDEMLTTQLPKNAERARVEYYISSRGYRMDPPPDKHTVVAVVRHIDTSTLEPATARVTFHFDVNDKLVSYDMQSVPEAAPQP